VTLAFLGYVTQPLVNWRIVPTPEADHLFSQAERLLLLYPGRQPRQTEIRRSISASYYGLFHFILANAANTYAGAKYRAEPRYALAYRSASHGWLRALCLDAAKPHVPGLLKPYVSPNAFGTLLRIFAFEVVDLQNAPHAADYDPTGSFLKQDAVLAVETARRAVIAFDSIRAAERQLFLALLLFPPRGRA
jgi:hypothetical protein